MWSLLQHQHYWLHVSKWASLLPSKAVFTKSTSSSHLCLGHRWPASDYTCILIPPSFLPFHFKRLIFLFVNDYSLIGVAKKTCNILFSALAMLHKMLASLASHERGPGIKQHTHSWGFAACSVLCRTGASVSSLFLFITGWYSMIQQFGYSPSGRFWLPWFLLFWGVSWIKVLQSLTRQIPDSFLW